MGTGVLPVKEATCGPQPCLESGGGAKEWHLALVRPWVGWAAQAPASQLQGVG